MAGYKFYYHVGREVVRFPLTVDEGDEVYRYRQAVFDYLIDHSHLPPTQTPLTVTNIAMDCNSIDLVDSLNMSLIVRDRRHRVNVRVIYEPYSSSAADGDAESSNGSPTKSDDGTDNIKEQVPPAFRGHSESQSEEPAQIQASHILSQHVNSHRPLSWHQTKITRTKEEAIDIIKGYREDIIKGRRKFEDIAREFSDCSSANADGNLGYFTRGKMQKPFEDAAFALKVGELSDVVQTDSGTHIILRTA